MNSEVLYQKEEKSQIQFPLILNIELGVVASAELQKFHDPKYIVKGYFEKFSANKLEILLKHQLNHYR